MTLIFPCVMIGLQFCAAVVYFAAGDKKHGVYWLAGAVITGAATSLGGK